jgi:hypothetical protein
VTVVCTNDGGFLKGGLFWKKRGVAWVEITDRPPRTAVPSSERVVFLRVVKYLRSNSAGIQLRDMNGHWRAPKNAVAFAAELLQIRVWHQKVIQPYNQKLETSQTVISLITLQQNRTDAFKLRMQQSWIR